MSFVVVFPQSTIKKTIKKNTTEKEQITSKPSIAIIALRKKHAEFLKNSLFKTTKMYSKKESLALGLPPNKYYEENWELSMDPETGRPSVEKLQALRIQLEQEQRNGILQRTPGDGIDNSWIERGPTNVGGRTRALMFDPNDPTYETVFAGGVSGGLWKNANISNPNSIWTKVGIPENLAVSCITSDPNNPQIFYVGTGESYVGGDANGDGVWKSINGGTTWNKVFGGISGATYFNSASSFTVNTPSGIAGNYMMVEAPTSFSAAPRITAPIISNVVFQNDLPTDTNATVCDPFPNPGSLAGKIALIRRGNCPFTSKVKAAQNAGAIAVIIMNNNSDLPSALGGTDPSITIPAVMISRAHGDMLQNALLSGPVNVTLTPSDGTFTGNMVPGVQHINALKVRNNGGISEVYVAAGDTQYSAASITTYIGGTTFGLYKSTNNGLNWDPVILPLTADGKKHAPNDIEIGADNKVWVATTNSRLYGNGGGKVFSSIDGTNFIEKFAVPNGLRTQIAVSKTDPNKVYVLAQLNVTNAVETTFIKTINNFASTTVLAKPINVNTAPRFDTYGFTGQQAFYDLVLEVDPSNDEKLFTGGVDIFSSVNGGVSWSQTSVWTPVATAALPVVHADQHAVVFGPGNKLLFGNDGGVYFSNDYGATVPSRNKGFNVTQFYSIGLSPTTNGLPGDNFVAGAQDNGSQMFTNATPGPNTSVEVQGGDGAYSMFDQDGTDKYRITNYVYNDRIMSFNYATGTPRTINSETGTTGSNGAFISPMALDSKLDILYSDYAKGANIIVRRYKNIKSGTIQKAPLTNALLNSAATALMVSPFPPTTGSTSTLLIGTRSGRLLKVINADNGTTTAGSAVGWSNITGPGFVGSVSDVEYGSSENEIYVTFHNYNVVSVWYTNNGGITWQNKEGDLPDLPVKCILRNPLNADEVIIGTDLGVWASSNFTSSSPTWTRSDNGMQNVRVTDLDLRNDNTVYAATYGRGIFSGLFTAITLGTTNFKNNLLVNVYPNPSDGQITIKINEYNGKVNLQVVDLNGRVVYSSNDSGFNVEKSINLENLQSGMYILKMNGEGFGYTKKIIIK